MKPILFNTEMVRAILDGRKTVTRRCIKPKYGNTHFEYRTDKYGTQFVEMQNDEEGVTYGKHEDGSCWRGMKGFLIPKSKYEVGDILYVQETWKIDSVAKHLNNMLIDFKAIKNGYSQSEVSVNLSKERFDKFKKFYQKNGWKSPCSMPKETARIFLRVTDVRVEHLQDMYLKDFLNEGIMVREESFNDPENAYYQAKEFFRKLWNSTIKKAELNQYGWDVNPYVWVYEFEVISKEEAMKERSR